MEPEKPSEQVDEAAIARYISATFDNVHVVEANGTSFFFFGPMDNEHNMFPFATLVTNDYNDTASDLERPGVFRLNVGVSKPTFLALFGAPVPRPGPDGIIDAGYDYTALDTLMPHPVYGNMYWMCVLNPSASTFERVRPLLAEGYEMTVQRLSKRA